MRRCKRHVTRAGRGRFGESGQFHVSTTHLGEHNRMPRCWTPIVRHVIQARPTAQAQLTGQVEAYDFHEAPPRFKFRPTAREASLCQSATSTEWNRAGAPFSRDFPSRPSSPAKDRHLE